jgi:S-adenosylmethionine hydrolase
MTTIALLTDFGNDDIYVGVMKGVMRGIHPQADFIDITHTISPQHVREAAFSLSNAFRYFPKGTVFLVVVDPGVGSMRRPIAVQASGYTFIAPDNGVLSYALAFADHVEAVALDNPDYHLKNVSQTFHGRDIFAPVSAHLANGVPLAEIGSSVTDLVSLPVPRLEISPSSVQGEVLHIDRFGNLITSIGRLSWVDAERMTLYPAFGEELFSVPINLSQAEVWVNQQNVSTIQRSYSDVRRGELLALLGSSGYLEISVNQGNAAQRLDVAVGDPVELKLG